jgi:hypothetical protein
VCILGAAFGSLALAMAVVDWRRPVPAHGPAS